MSVRNEMYGERVAVYDRAIFKYGMENQVVVAIEEMSEVQKELCKFLRGKGDPEHLAEEIADAFITLEQMEYFHGLTTLVTRKMDEKMRRLARDVKG